MGSKSEKNRFPDVQKSRKLNGGRWHRLGWAACLNYQPVLVQQEDRPPSKSLGAEGTETRPFFVFRVHLSIICSTASIQCPFSLIASRILSLVLSSQTSLKCPGLQQSRRAQPQAPELCRGTVPSPSWETHPKPKMLPWQSLQPHREEDSATTFQALHYLKKGRREMSEVFYFGYEPFSSTWSWANFSFLLEYI